MVGKSNSGSTRQHLLSLFGAVLVVASGMVGIATGGQITAADSVSSDALGVTEHRRSLALQEDPLSVDINCDQNGISFASSADEDYRVLVIVADVPATQNATDLANIQSQSITNISGPTDGAETISFNGVGVVNVAVQRISDDDQGALQTVFLAARDCTVDAPPSVPEIDCAAKEIRVAAPSSFEYRMAITVTVVGEGNTSLNFQQLTDPTSGESTTAYAVPTAEGIPTVGAEGVTVVVIDTSTNNAIVTLTKDCEIASSG